MCCMFVKSNNNKKLLRGQERERERGIISVCCPKSGVLTHLSLRARSVNDVKVAVGPSLLVARRPQVGGALRVMEREE